MKDWPAIVREAVMAAAPFVLRMTPLEFALLTLSIAQFLLAISSASARIAGMRLVVRPSQHARLLVLGAGGHAGSAP
jgi:hypothetical protein